MICQQEEKSYVVLYRKIIMTMMTHSQRNKNELGSKRRKISRVARREQDQSTLFRFFLSSKVLNARIPLSWGCVKDAMENTTTASGKQEGGIRSARMGEWSTMERRRSWRRHESTILDTFRNWWMLLAIRKSLEEKRCRELFWKRTSSHFSLVCLENMRGCHRLRHHHGPQRFKGEYGATRISWEEGVTDLCFETCNLSKYHNHGIGKHRESDWKSCERLSVSRWWKISRTNSKCYWTRWSTTMIAPVWWCWFLFFGLLFGHFTEWWYTDDDENNKDSDLLFNRIWRQVESFGTSHQLLLSERKEDQDVIMRMMKKRSVIFFISITQLHRSSKWRPLLATFSSCFSSSQTSQSSK